MNTRRKRIWALGMAIALGATSLFDYQFFRTKNANAGETVMMTKDKVVFAQGEGIEDENGNKVDFSSDSWTFTGRGVNSSNQKYDVAAAFKPSIVDDAKENNYLKSADVDTTNVIRLIRGVKENATKAGEEAADSYYDYRSGAAFLTEPIKFGDDAKFSITYTFSMPEAVVNYSQAGGEEFAREPGGDGIGFVMTTKQTTAVEAGSGMGYQNMSDSLTIEADSFFNGAYCYLSGHNSFDLQNWGFDNQLYLRSNGTDGGTDDFNNDPYKNGYIKNYLNPSHEERFDHFAITENGGVKEHKNIYYVNELNPTEMEGNLYKNLAGSIKRNATDANYVTYNSLASKSSATASKESSCSTRFADKGVDDRLFTVWVDYDGTTIRVYYANGALSKVTKPDTAIMIQDISMERFSNKDVYLGFTSAIGTSKANHTIHSLKITIPEEVEVAAASCVLKYWIKNPTTGEYELQEADTTDVYTTNVGATVTAMDLDGGKYATMYEHKGYVLSTTKQQELSVDLVESNDVKIYEMNAYYDPIPKEQASYKINYYVKNAMGVYELKESSPVETDSVGAKHSVETEDPNYKTKYPGYTINQNKKEDYEVTLTEAGKLYEMNVYYDPEVVLPGVKLNYHKLNPNTNQYEYIESTQVQSAKVDDKKTVEDLDANYKEKYKSDGYTYNESKKDTYSVDIVEDNKIYEVDAYYDPALTKYTTEYYLEQPDGTFEKQTADTIITENVYVGKDVTAKEKTYPGYTHVTIDKSNEKDTVAADGNTVLKVYYKIAKEEAYYKLNYFVKDENGEYVLKDSTEVETDVLGTTHTVETVDPDYKTKYPGYSVNEEKNKEYEVKLTENGKLYQMNVYYDPQEAKYKLNYHLGDGNGTYTLDASTEAVTGIVGNTYTVTDVDPKYGTKYPNYSVNKNKNEEYEVKLTEAGKTYEMHVYYDPETIIPGVKLNYYKFNPNTEKYEYIESTKTESANVNDTKTVEDLDADYKQKYANDGYTYNSNKKETYSVNIESNDKVYEVDAYYDPTITKYTTEYYLQQPDGSYKKQEDDTIVTNNVYAGKNVTAQEKTYNNYTHVIIDDKSKEQATVKADGSTVLKVYYNLVEKPQEEAYYLLNYYVKNDKGEYELKDSTAKKTDAVGSNHTVTDVDPNYKTKYPNYTVNGNKNTEYTVILTKAGETYEMNVYYDPVLTEYKTEYYLEQPDGTFKKQDPDTIVTKDVHAGISVTAQEKTYNGYTHVTVAESKEKDTVAADGSTVLKVYYKLIAVTSAPAVVATPTPTPVVTATPVVTETPVPVVKVTPTPKAKVTKKPAQTQVDLDGDAPADSTKGSPKTPETGDHTNWKLPMVLMVFSAAIAGGLFVKLRKKEEKEDKEQ